VVRGLQRRKLQELMRTALEQNYDLRDAVARVEEARANLGITHSNQLPQVNASGGLGIHASLARRPDASAGVRSSPTRIATGDKRRSICSPLKWISGAGSAGRLKPRAPIF
jgi:outer membrane protein TolC